jgi:phosphohistidine phosphatase
MYLLISLLSWQTTRQFIDEKGGMKLYLARHGDYTLNSTGVDVLSERGTNDITYVAKWIKPMNLAVSHIFHSGKNRAQQTAELLAEGFICEEGPVSHAGLNPNDEVATIVSEVLIEENNMLLVGHLPFMDRLVSLLLTGQDSKNIINFQTGTLVCLSQIDQFRWVIDWVLTPSMFST